MLSPTTSKFQVNGKSPCLEDDVTYVGLPLRAWDLEVCRGQNSVKNTLQAPLYHRRPGHARSVVTCRKGKDVGANCNARLIDSKSYTHRASVGITTEGKDSEYYLILYMV